MPSGISLTLTVGCGK